jgi:hypothetical protein
MYKWWVCVTESDNNTLSTLSTTFHSQICYNRFFFLLSFISSLSSSPPNFSSLTFFALFLSSHWLVLLDILVFRSSFRKFIHIYYYGFSLYNTLLTFLNLFILIFSLAHGICTKLLVKSWFQKKKCVKYVIQFDFWFLKSTNLVNWNCICRLCLYATLLSINLFLSLYSLLICWWIMK